MFMFESKFDIWMLCVHIFYKLFQLLIRIKGDKSIISIPPINVRKKILWAIKKPLFFKMTKNWVAKVDPSGDPLATPSNWR